MQKEYYYYFQLFGNLISGVLKDGTKVQFIQTNNSKMLGSIFINYLQNNNHDKFKTHFCRRDGDKYIHNPYYPFLDIVVDKLSLKSDVEISEIFDKLDVYYFHREILQNYIKGNELFRAEEILDDELDYEKAMLEESIIRLFEYVYADEKAVIYVEDIHFLYQSTFNILERYIHRQNQGNILFVCVYTWDDSQMDDLVEKQQLQFFRSIEKENLSIEVYFPDTFGAERKNPVISDIEHPVQKDRLIEAARKSFYFLAYSETLFYIQLLFNQGKLSFTDEELLDLYLLSAVSYSFLLKYESGLIYIYQAMNIANKLDDKEKLAYIYYYTAMIFYRKADYKNSEKNAMIALNIAKEYDFISIEFKCRLMVFQLDDKRRTLTPNQWEISFFDIVEMGRELGMVNTLIFCYTNPFGVYSNYSEKIGRIHQKGIKLASLFKNHHRLAKAYQTRGMAFAVRGNYDKVLNYYLRARKIIIRLNEDLSLAHINNGIGFFYYLSGDYNLAFRYYKRALNQLRQLHDYHEIAMTFYNIAVNYFLSFKYSIALQYLENVLRLMKIFKMENLAYHSAFGIYSLISLCYFLAGEKTKGYQFFIKIHIYKLKPYHKKNEEFFLYEMLRVQMKINEDKVNEAEHHLKKAYYYLNRTNDVITYFTPFYHYFSYLLYRNTDNVKAEKCVDEGFQDASRRKNEFYIDVFRNLKIDKPILKEGFNDKVLNFDSFLYSAEMEMNLIRLQKRIHEINFINNLQSILSGSNSKDEVLLKVVEVFKTNFLVDNIFVFAFRDEKWCYYSFDDIIVEDDKFIEHDENVESKKNIENLSIEELEAKVSKFVDFDKTQLVSSENVDDMKCCESLLSMHITVNDNEKYCFVMMNKDKNQKYDYNDLKILNIVSNQLGIYLEKINQTGKIIEKNHELNITNKRLKIAASTDELTGLRNRSAIYSIIQELKSKTSGSDISVFFLDLDNFKYVNDTFGHHVGDHVLQCFSKMITEKVEFDDVIARFGGDEFIIMRFDKTVLQNKQLASSIIDHINTQAFFDTIISEFVGNSKSLKRSKSVSCSIGVVGAFLEDNDVEKLFQLADQALYKAKNLGKNQYLLFEQ